MAPSWFLWSALCAFLYALEGAWAKRVSRRGFDPVFIAWFGEILICPFLWYFALREPWPALGRSFWLPFTAAAAGNTVALVYYFRALAAGELSVVYPLMALSPVMMLVSTQAITGEFPSRAALGGIALISAGCYGLGLDGSGWRAPFRRLWNDPGSRAALWTCALWSLTSSYDRLAVQASTRFLYPAIHASVLCVTLLPWAFSGAAAGLRKLRDPVELGEILVQSAIGLGVVLSQFSAVGLAQATYVIAVKRAGIVPAALIGWKVYGEGYGPRRIFLSFVVLSGLLMMLF